MTIRRLTVQPFQIAGSEWLGDPTSPPAVLQPCNGADEIVEVGPALAFPGLINSHDHLDFNCYPPLGSPPYTDFTAWTRDVQRDNRHLIDTIEGIPRPARLLFGALKNLLWGVTAVAHHGAPIPAGLELPIGVIANFDVVHSPELERYGRLEFLKAWKRRPIAAHVAEATTSESRARACAFARWNLFHRQLVGIHGVALAPADFPLFDALVWCPASNFNLLNATADVAAAKQSLTVLFGTDSTLSAPGTLWDHLRQAREVGGLSDDELFGSLTGEAARFWNVPERNGDLVIARKKRPARWDAFYSITPADILLVMSAGRAVLADETLVSAHPQMFGSLTKLSLPTGAKWVALDTDELTVELRQRLASGDVDALLGRIG